MSGGERTPAEIVERIEGLGDSDPFGWSRVLLVSYLPYDHAKPYLKEGVSEAEWEPCTDPRADCIDYLEFAWGKAHDERGISANRSVDKIRHWLWLMGDDDTLARFDAADYYPYGIPMLTVATEALAPDRLAALSRARGDR